ncbi:MAG: hypothetical protein KAV00_07045 [Phycisphaerae bacterium]|nr:hypothetical protein [Phycisphaerae bacterium]
MSVKVKMFYGYPDGKSEIVDFDPDTLIQTIETYLDDMAATVHELEGIDAYRELLIRVENIDE